MKLRMLARRLLLSFLVVTLTAARLPAYGAVVTGTVKNGSREGMPIANCQVTLIRFSSATFERTVLDSLRTKRGGRFRFQRVMPDSGAVFLVSADYMGVPYFSQMFHLLGTDTTVSLSITVYDTTQQQPAIHVQMHHVFVEPDTEDYLIREILVYHAISNKTFVAPPNGHTLALSIPTGAYAFQAETGFDMSAISQEGNTLYSAQPLIPGTHQVSYTYRLAPHGGKVSYSRAVDYPTAVLSFLVSDLTTKVASRTLARDENFTIRGREYIRLAGSNLEPGSVVEVTLSRGGLLASPNLRWLVPLALAVAVAIVLILLVRYPRVKETQKRQADPLVKRRDQLLYEIAELDEAFEAGNVPEEEYRTRRKQLKNEVMQLTQRLRSGGNTAD